MTQVVVRVDRDQGPCRLPGRLNVNRLRFADDDLTGGQIDVGGNQAGNRDVAALADPKLVNLLFPHQM